MRFALRHPSVTRIIKTIRVLRARRINRYAAAAALEKHLKTRCKVLGPARRPCPCDALTNIVRQQRRQRRRRRRRLTTTATTTTLGTTTATIGANTILFLLMCPSGGRRRLCSYHTIIMIIVMPSPPPPPTAIAVTRHQRCPRAA